MQNKLKDYWTTLQAKVDKTQRNLANIENIVAMLGLITFFNFIFLAIIYMELLDMKH